MPKEPSYVQTTLEWCNEMRERRGMEALSELPKGIRRDGSSCPCGRATGLHVRRDSAYDPNTRISIPIPYDVTLFTYDFDNGLLPQYEIGWSDKNA
jgi:hypothetical protein